MADPFLMLAILSFPVLAAYAAASDLLTMTIPNWVSVGLIAGFSAGALLIGLDLSAIGLHFAVGAATLAVTFTLFALGWIGGGDAKLAAAMALWMGGEHILAFVLHASVYGGALTLLLLAFRKMPIPLFAIRVDWISRLYARETGVPYGIALSLAGLMVFPQTVFMRVLVGG